MKARIMWLLSAIIFTGVGLFLGKLLIPELPGKVMFLVLSSMSIAYTAALLTFPRCKKS